jgi:5'-phosphate synthase pdxT subunit
MTNLCHLADGSMSEMVVGVLALQGAFAKHAEMLAGLGVSVIEVRKEADLAKCDALIIPGGESSTIMRNIHFLSLENPLMNFAKTKPIFGTCAGLILMSKKILADSMNPFGWISVEVERNAFGTQVESFQTQIDVHLSAGKSKQVPAFFIRAPRIRNIEEKVEVLAAFENEPVLVRQGHYLGATFHPELTKDVTIHEYFLNMVKEAKKLRKN